MSYKNEFRNLRKVRWDYSSGFRILPLFKEAFEDCHEYDEIWEEVKYISANYLDDPYDNLKSSKITLSPWKFPSPLPPPPKKKNA